MPETPIFAVFFTVEFIAKLLIYTKHIFAVEFIALVFSWFFLIKSLRIIVIEYCHNSLLLFIKNVWLSTIFHFDL